MVYELGYNPIPFDDTYVLYDPSSRLSFACAGLSLLPIGILVFYLSWFIVTREVEPCIMAAGQVVNDVLNNLVKNYVKQPRPVQFVGFQENGLRSGYGMPSAHSQFMGFFATYLLLRLWLQWRGVCALKKSIASLIILVVSISVVFARVYLNYHNVEQVLVGSSIGCSLGATFFFLGTLARVMGVVDWALELYPAKVLHIKDSCFFEPLSLQDERRLWEQRRLKSKTE